MILNKLKKIAANPLPGRCKRQIDFEQCQSTSVKGFYYDLNADKCRECKNFFPLIIIKSNLIINFFTTDDGSGCLKCSIYFKSWNKWENLFTTHCDHMAT